MEYFHALSLAFLEMTFLFVGLSLLYNQRSATGQAPFHMALGVLLLFAHLVAAADIRATLAGTLDFPIGPIVIFLPLMAAFLMVYIIDGTLAAQRIILGVVALYGLYLYLGEITRLQCNWLGFSITAGLPGATLDRLLGASRASMNVTALSRLLDFFLLPIVFTRCKNYGINRFFSILLAFYAAHLVGALLRQLVLTLLGLPAELIDGEFLARAIAELWLAALLSIYLAKIEKDVRTGEKSPLDILFAFFGSYGRSKELEAHLREWENRYQLVLENAGELILMTDEEGRIVDANLSAVKLLGAESAASLEKRPLFPRLRVISPPEFQLDRVPAAPVRFRCILDEQSSRAVTLACTLSPIRLRGQTLLVLIGSDITEETRLAAERERLSEQLTHSQRIESLGLLAGGIAHDFNNYIHAILGHVDVITLLYPPENPEVTAHLEKISGIAEQAGHLTSQLLGFARKGKYRVTDVDIRKTIESSLALLGPNKRQVEISFRTIPGMPTVRADSLQLQQVLLNLMLNAIDAMEQNEGEQRLTLFAGPATEAPLPFSPPADHPGARPEDYIFIQVADNGCGMDHATIEKAFEPFFTTKPVGRGTGMGLAMVYGTVSHHQGWIQLESTPGAGSNFCIFLPCSGPADSQEKP